MEDTDALLEQNPEEALSRRESELAAREARLAAQDELTRRGLPQSLMPMLPLESAGSLTGAIDGLETAFKAAVEEAVGQRLKGRAPVLGGAQDEQSAALRRAFGLK